MSKLNLLELTPDQFRGFITDFGEPAYRAKQILDWVWNKDAQSFAQMSNLPKDIRSRLADKVTMGSIRQEDVQTSSDGTIKLLFSLTDRQTVETVILTYEIGDSVCLSTQVGCRMGCVFCASGLPGYIRNLTSGEIMAQLLAVRRMLRKQGRELKSIVLMGSGEPLDNWEATIAFLEAVRDPERLGMSLRHVTLSTSGLVPKIMELAELGWPLTLAVSLHASNNMIRERIMPINKKYPLEILLPACDHYAARTGRRVTYEYILIKGLNDEVVHARELAKLLKGRLCHINLIPFNAVAELDWQPSTNEKTRTFLKIVKNAGISITVRRRMGRDIAAACGQLRNNYCGNSGEKIEG